MDGEDVPAEPVNAKPRKAPDAATPQPPAWGAPATPSAAQAGVPWATAGANPPPQAAARNRSGLAQRLNPATDSAHDRRRVAGAHHA